MDIVTGNAYEADTRGTGWFLGFSDWTRLARSDLLHVPRDQPLSGLCLKWWDHPGGDESGNGKPVSEGRSLSLLVSAPSRFCVEFCESAAYPAAAVRQVVLQRPGDFVAWGAGLFHRWRCEQRATIMTLRWNEGAAAAPTARPAVPSQRG